MNIAHIQIALVWHGRIGNVNKLFSAILMASCLYEIIQVYIHGAFKLEYCNSSWHAFWWLVYFFYFVVMGKLLFVQCPHGWWRKCLRAWDTTLYARNVGDHDRMSGISSISLLLHFSCILYIYIMAWLK